MDIARPIFVIALCLPLLLQPVVHGQANGLPLKPTRFIEFMANEGTNISLDVSPDGRTIVFALLGDIYTIPIEGGSARRITSGIALDSLPRFSPDGKRIAFASDRSGMANLWTMATDGSDARMVSKFSNVMDPGAPRLFTQLDWRRDGRVLIAAQSTKATTEYDYSTYDLASGLATDLAPSVPTAYHTGENNGGALSADGRFFWYARGSLGADAALESLMRSPEASSSLEFVGRAEAMSVGVRGLAKLELVTGRTEIIPSRSAAVVTPLISPDGRWIAYKTSRFVRGELLGHLRVHDARSNEPLDNDPVLGQADAITSAGIYQYAFTPDSKGLVYTAAGKIKQVDIATRKVRDIPFTAAVRAELGPYLPPPTQVFSGPLPVRQLRSVNTVDGRTIVFNALGKIWSVSNGRAPRRLTSGTLREYQPVVSPDGQWVAYVTWSFVDGGRLWKMPLAGGESIQLAQFKEVVSAPRWMPDGKRLVFLRSVTRSPDGNGVVDGWVMSIDAAGGEALTLAPATDRRSFSGHLPSLTVSADGQRVYFIDTKDLAQANGTKDDPREVGMLCSVRIDGTDRQRHARLKGFDIVAAPSPDGRWLAFHHAFNVYVMPFPQNDGSGTVPLITMKGSTPDSRAKALTREGGAHPIWSADGRWLSWSWGAQLFRLPYAQATGSGAIRPQVTTIDLKAPRAAPPGHLLLKGARIVTMAASGSPRSSEYRGEPMATDPKVIERGDILLAGERIAAVGPSGTLKVPAQTRVVEVGGKTIVPGYFATHEHREREGGAGAMVAEQLYRYASFVAYGLTSAKDPWYGYSAMYVDEMVAAGELVGPRWVGGLNGLIANPHGNGTGDDIPDSAAAEALVKKHKSSGAYLIKEYGSARHRIQRQWIAIAARRQGIMLTQEPYPDAEFTDIFDGWTTEEHSGPGRLVFADMRELIKRSGMSVPYSHFRPMGISTPEVQAKKIELMKEEIGRGWHMPGETKQRNAGVTNQENVEALWVPMLSRAIKEQVDLKYRDLVRSGVDVTIGTDMGSPTAPHSWLWQLSTSGMTNAELLRIFTLNGARALGAAADLGSIEPGKLADFVVLNSNPLDDITNTTDIAYVVQNGDVYDPRTLDVLFPVPRKFQMFPWARNPNNASGTLR